MTFTRSLIPSNASWYFSFSRTPHPPPHQRLAFVTRATTSQNDKSIRRRTRAKRCYDTLLFSVFFFLFFLFSVNYYVSRTSVGGVPNYPRGYAEGQLNQFDYPRSVEPEEGRSRASQLHLHNESVYDIRGPSTVLLPLLRARTCIYYNKTRTRVRAGTCAGYAKPYFVTQSRSQCVFAVFICARVSEDRRRRKYRI